MAITHENMIASILQATSFYKATRERGAEVTLGFLPFNHIYGLLITHALMYYGDSIIVHRGFNLMEVLTSIMKYRINTLYLVSVSIEPIFSPLVLFRMQADGTRCHPSSTLYRETHPY